MVALLSHWREDLRRTRKSAFGRLAGVLGATQINDQTWEDLESLLIQADLGADTTDEVIGNLRSVVSQQGLRSADELRRALAAELRARLVPPPPLDWVDRPNVILVVGVNGCGKTTTIAKLSHFLKTTGQVGSDRCRRHVQGRGGRATCRLGARASPSMSFRAPMGEIQARSHSMQFKPAWRAAST